MPFSIHVASIADCPALVTVWVAAFNDDPIVGYLSRHVAPDVSYAFRLQVYERRFQGSALSGLRVFKVVDKATGWVVFFFFLVLILLVGYGMGTLDRATSRSPQNRG